MKAIPGFTAERSMDGWGVHYKNDGGISARMGMSGEVTAAFHCHLESHTPDPAHGYPSCPGHDWFGTDCVYYWCD
jgi:hypothetical protein